MCDFLSLMTSVGYLLAGIPGAVSSAESVTSSVQESAQLHEDDQATEVPGGIRSGKGHESGQFISRPLGKVSTREIYS
jgi:hypothetical protein